MSTTAQVPDQIEGLPPGAILRPLPQQAIEGLPPGAVLKPIGKVAQATTPNPYQQAAERIPGGTGTSMSAGPPKPAAEGPGFFERLIHAVGIPTSQGETTTAVQHMLTPQPEPDAEGLLKTEESLPVVGSDFRARATLARQGRPTAMIPFLGPAIASFVDATAGAHPDTATALGSGINVAGQALGLKSLLTPKPPVPMVKLPDVPLPHHVEALTGLIEDRGGTVDPHAMATTALPPIREAAIRMGVDPSKLEGRAAGQATLQVTERAVNEAQNEFNTIRQPYNPVLVDRASIAKVYRDAITPDLLESEPKVAKALEAQAKKLDQPAPLEQVNQFRVRMNNRLDAFEKKGASQQLMDDVQTRADAAAADAARDVEYATVGRLSGLDPKYIRELKQREGALIETKRSLTKEYNRASGAQGEAITESMREKLTHTFPSKHGVGKSVLKNVFGPKPIDILNSRIQKMFAGMGGVSELPEYEQVQPPTAPQPVMEGGPSGPVSGAPEDAVSEVTRRGPGVDPEAAASRERQAEFLRTKRENLAGQRKEVPQKAGDIRKELERPAASASAAVAGGQITPEHVAAENAFYTQARAELGANASASDVLRRAQALKIEHAAKGAPPPVTPVPPTVRPTLTQRVQAQPTLTLRRVNPPVKPSDLTGQTPRQQATALMLLVKQGKLTPAEADSRIQRLVGPGGRRMIRRPAAPE
jgi:hypothetical protein